MSAPLPSDEVAEDYRTSLEDLISNDRYQISNLTLIAKENVEHAEAISRVLQNHITRVSSQCLHFRPLLTWLGTPRPEAASSVRLG